MRMIRISDQAVNLDESQQYLLFPLSSFLTLPFILLELIPLNPARMFPTEMQNPPLGSAVEHRP